MTFQRSRIGLLPAIVLAGLGLVGCGHTVQVGSSGSGSVSQSDLAAKVKTTLTGGDTASATVTCAGPLAEKVGATQDCDVTVGGATTGLHLTVDKADDGDVHWTQQPFLHGKDLDAAIAQHAGAQPTDLSCPDLTGKVGTSIVCSVSKGSAKEVDVTVTSVNGLRVAFNFKAK